MDSTAERVKRILAAQLDRDVGDIGMGTELEEDLGADPLDVECLLMAVEEEFDVELDGRGLRSVGDIVRAVDA